MKTKHCPPLTNGLYYGEDKDGHRVCRGACMGRPTRLPQCPETASPKLYLRRLRFVDGCYDQGGAYWGFPANLYRAACYGVDGHVVEVFTRADSPQEAKANVREQIPYARFFN